MIEHFACPKAGNEPAEYEDATAWSEAIVAMADGATESYGSGLWAQVLVEHLARAPWEYALNASATLWQRVEGARAAWQQQRPPPIRWHAKIKEAEGSAAAIAVLLLDATQRAYHVLGVGDVTFMHVRGQQRVVSWPLDDPAAFSDRPALVRTRGDQRRFVLQHQDHVAVGDHLLLLTDALAAWVLTCERAGRPIYTQLQEMDDAAFAEFITAARADGMKNDDVTLARLTVMSPDDAGHVVGVTGGLP